MSLSLLWGGGCPVAPAAPADPGRVVAIVSAGHPAYLLAEEAAAKALLGAFPRTRILAVHLDRSDGVESAKAAFSEHPDLVLAIGSRAAALARELGPDVPLVYAMVLDPGSIGLPGPGESPTGPVTGVTMDVTPERQFELLRELVPSAHRVGVLYNPAISGSAVRQAVAAARTKGLTLVTQAVRTEAEVIASASLLAPGVDALWAIADPTVLTSANARALVLFSLRSRKPLIAVSEGFVRSGALAALAADPVQVGRRAGELAVRLLEGTPVRSLRPESPPSVLLFVNRATAEHFGLSLPSAVISRARTVYPES